MMLIYQSPRGKRIRSAPIAEKDTRSRATLERAGWKVVETLDDADKVTSEPAGDVIDPEAGVQSPVTADTGPQLATLDVLSPEQRAALVKAGYISLDNLRAATDAELRAVEGIGPAAVRHVREALAKG